MTGLDTGSTWLRGNGKFELRPDPDALTVIALLKRRLPHAAGRQVVHHGKHPESAAVLGKRAFDVFYGTTSHGDGRFRYPLVVCAPEYLTGKGGQRAHDFLDWEFRKPGTRRALLQGDWKPVQHAVSKNGKPELHQIREDLAETNDLAARLPEGVAAMLRIMENRRKPSPVFPDKSLDRQQLTASP
jgi:hypothetical protein